MRRGVVLGAVGLMGLHFVFRVGFGWQTWSPDLSTLGLLVLAREVRSGASAAAGFGLGLLEDSLSSLAFGASTMAMTVVAAVGGRTRDLFEGDSLTFVVAYLFLGKWGRDLIQWVMTAPELREPLQRTLLVDSVVASAYVALVGLALVRLVGNWLKTGTRSMGGVT
jgi:rod shape-determining protein MreD